MPVALALVALVLVVCGWALSVGFISTDGMEDSGYNLGYSIGTFLANLIARTLGR